MVLNFRQKLIVFSAFSGALLAFMLPVFVNLEYASFDERVRQVRYLRGNLAPSNASLMLGFTEATRDTIKSWSIGEERAVFREVRDNAKGVWVDPHLGWSLVPAGLRAEPLPLVPDSDGTVRRVELANGTQISPALRLYAIHKGVDLQDIEVAESHILLGEERLPRWLPVDFPPHSADSATEGSQLYLEPPSIHLLFEETGGAHGSSRDLLLGLIENRLVMLVNHTQAARRRVDTPVGNLERHQIMYSALDTLLTGWRLEEAPLALSVVLTLLLCGLASWGAVRSPSFVITILTWLVCAYAYRELTLRTFAWGYSLPVVPVIAGSLISIGLVAAVLQFRAFRIMKQLVGEDRAADAARGEIDLGGKERPVTILFTNLPKAIQALEQVDPEESIRARILYARTLTKVVRDNQGRILDYQGDFQMAGFCVEKVDPDHALNAVKAGLELCKLLNEQYPDEDIHCGVCTGPAAVGYVGAPTSKELAAIGDTTNVAARLLGAAIKQGVDLLISAPTYDLCSDHLEAEKLPSVSLKGKTSNVEVYQVRALK